MAKFEDLVRRHQARAAAAALVAGVVFSVLLGAALVCVGRPGPAAATVAGVR